MELLTLDSNFQPNDLVENYSSLIWTERYAKNGDFQLISTSISDTIATLPLESYITLRDSTQVMKVELHKIEKSRDKGPQITVTGRTFEATTLELRASVNDLITNAPPKPWNLVATKESDAAYLVIRQAIGDPDVYMSGKKIISARGAAVDSVRDAIPEVKLIMPADYTVSVWDPTITYTYIAEIVEYAGSFWYSTGVTGNHAQTPTDPGSTYWFLVGLTGDATGLPTDPGVSYSIKTQNLYTTVMEFLAINFRGIKSVRPAPGANQVGIEIYNGTDRTNEVRFEARLDQLATATYLFSQTGSTNVAYIYSSAAASKVGKNAYDLSHPEPSGLNRRILTIDATSDATATQETARKSEALAQLYQNNVTALFGGEVGVQMAAGYNNTYFLGDILKLVGDYGLSADVRVAEFIRSDDGTGEKAFPTLEVVS